MRIYLRDKQSRPVLDKDGNETAAVRKYGSGFYPSGRVPADLAQEWVDAGIACPASDDNVAEWPEDPEQTREHEPTPDEADSGDGDHSGLLTNDGPPMSDWDGKHYTPSASVTEGEDDGT
jgi:hypothetical protein